MENTQIVLTRDFLNSYLDKFDERYEKLVFERQENSLRHNTVEWGNEVYECIKENDIDGMVDALSRVTRMYQPGKLSKDDLRSSKNLIIGLITVISNWAARDNLISNELILTSSDVIILMCEETKDYQDLIRCCYAGLLKISNLIKENRESGYHPLVIKAKEIVFHHLHDSITPSSIASDLNVSPEHLSRTFHKAEGITIENYIVKEKIERAKKLLRLSSLSISEISSYLCFSSSSHFGQSFKKYVGITPHMYRMKFMNDKRDSV